jgi:threonine/homoserine/homoserine lactone efflux protein
MVDTGRALALAATAFVIIVIPGPSVLFVISRGVTLGRRAGLATVVGNTLGLAVQLLAVTVGLGAVVARSVAVFTVVKLLGAAYLVYLGVKAVRHRRSLVDAFHRGLAPAPTGRILREGFFVGVTNPKSVILFTAILPQFVDPSRGHAPIQLVVLGLICLLIALASDSAWAVASGSVRAWLGRRPERLAAIGGVGGLVTIGLGLRLALTGRHD